MENAISDPKDLKAQFVAAAEVSEDGKTIKVGRLTATDKTGPLARIFGMKTWQIEGKAELSGNGSFTDTAYVQRVNTRRGVVPATTCNDAANGTRADVTYQADYIFWKVR